ncbi:MAG: hypothetical protein L6R45_20865 [Anaerolineae bacterium]|nr:hypothetical protein [Anaerolineae bacterium]
MNDFKRAGLITLLAGFYFASVYFAVAALVPELALQAALVAVIGVMVVFRILGITGSNKPGAPMAILIFAPVICIAAGILWWLMRLLGFWEIK